MKQRPWLGALLAALLLLAVTVPAQADDGAAPSLLDRVVAFFDALLGAPGASDDVPAAPAKPTASTQDTGGAQAEGDPNPEGGIDIDPHG